MLGGVEHLRPAVAQVGLEGGRHTGDAADVGAMGRGRQYKVQGGKEIGPYLGYCGKGGHQTNRYNSKATGDFRHS